MKSQKERRSVDDKNEIDKIPEKEYNIPKEIEELAEVEETEK